MASPVATGTRTIYQVGELTGILRGLLEDALPRIWVQGEISNFSRPASGHWYFTLKDAQAQLRCVMFKGSNFYVKPQPRDGDQVLLRAQVSLYTARGDLQLICDHLEPAGEGALLRAFEQLKQKLAVEGLFDAKLKRPLPPAPRAIGLITSGTGAALQDMLTTLARRYPLGRVFLYPVPVQGAEAAPAIVKALAELPRRAPVDVIILGRGGGSLEDLWAFNEEAVARAIRACTVPVVSGVGHEVDVTIADFAADLRAATPTAAAERVSPNLADWIDRLRDLQLTLVATQERTLERRHERLTTIGARLRLLHPGRRLLERAQRLDELDQRLRLAAGHLRRRQDGQLAQAFQRLQAVSPLQLLRREQLRRHAMDLRLKQAASGILGDHRVHQLRLQALLQSLSPQAVLDRGYAIAQLANGDVIRDASQLPAGTRYSLRLARGRSLGEALGPAGD